MEIIAPTADKSAALPAKAPELLAPAGDRTCLRAAIENGADAVYFGLDVGFNARARAENIAVETLPEVMAELHARGVKGYLTANTLVFSDELPSFEKHITAAVSAGIDAVLVQDLGAARLIHAICPELPIHASTQMTLSSAECIEVARRLGICRVVLPRELSLDEIRAIHAQTDMELEAFVHGALCVAYSGQCLTSESLGGRSANRGQCAQACRLPYELVCDGKTIPLGEQKYLLSPQDLAAFPLIPELIQAGVSSLKIEGRLKTPEYVANITRHYREAITQTLSQGQVQFSPQAVEEMELSFSRGFSPGWLNGCDHKMLVPATSSDKRGVLLGKVVGVRGNRVQVELTGSVRPGDGVQFAKHQADAAEQGGRVYEIYMRGQRVNDAGPGLVELTFGHHDIDLAQLAAGQILWKTDDPQLTRRLKQSFETCKPQRRLPLDVHVVARTGEPLRAIATAPNKTRVEVQLSDFLAVATKHPLTLEVLRQQLDRLGKTQFELGTVTAEIVGGPMTPLSVLGELRKTIVQRMDAALKAVPKKNVAKPNCLEKLRTATPPASSPTPPRLVVLCRSLSQLNVLLELGTQEIYADFADIRQYADATRLAEQHQAKLYLATPRIQKPGEAPLFKSLAKHGATGMLVRNLAGIAFCQQQQIPFVADYSLNATNELTIAWLREFGPLRITTSYDLNRDQLLQLVDATRPAWLEVVIHQHMPMFHMEHCVFCSLLSPGTNKTNCGRPCDDHLVHLRDRVGMEHLLTADVGCRNTLFNATPQSGAEIVPELGARGVAALRIELLEDRPSAEIERTLKLYQELLDGQRTGDEVWRALKAANRVGVTRGSLEERRSPLTII
jgi:putative protease